VGVLLCFKLIHLGDLRWLLESILSEKEDDECFGDGEQHCWALIYDCVVIFMWIRWDFSNVNLVYLAIKINKIKFREKFIIKKLPSSPPATFETFPFSSLTRLFIAMKKLKTFSPVHSCISHYDDD
jgi:hypothetical protein